MPPPKRNPPSGRKSTPAKKQKRSAKGKQRAAAQSVIDREAAGGETSEEDLTHVEEDFMPEPRVDSVASLIKGRRNYRLHVALYSTEFKDSVHTKKGPNSVLNAVFYDNTGYLNFTAWGSRAQSMNATLVKKQLYEMYNAMLKPANTFQNLGTLSASVDNNTILKPIAGPVPDPPRRTELDIAQCFIAETLKLHDLTNSIALQWTEVQSKITQKGEHTKLRSVDITSADLENRMILTVWGDDASHEVFGNDGDVQVPFEFKVTQVQIKAFQGNRTLETTRSGDFVVGRRRPDVDAAVVATTDFVSAGGNEKDAEIDSLARQLRRFYDKYGHKNESGQPHHSPSQIRKLATMYAGRSEKLNEGLAKKYANSLADLSESDDNGGMSDAEAML